MFLDPSQLPFSAKSDSRVLPPVKKTSERDREYLRPKEVEAMIGTAKKVGRHGIRDAAIILLMFRLGKIEPSKGDNTATRQLKRSSFPF